MSIVLLIFSFSDELDTCKSLNLQFLSVEQNKNKLVHFLHVCTM